MWPFSLPPPLQMDSPSFLAITLWGRSRKEGVVQWSNDYPNNLSISPLRAENNIPLGILGRAIFPSEKWIKST